jgi:hypothetical protein
MMTWMTSSWMVIINGSTWQHHGHHVEIILMTTFIISDGLKDMRKLHHSISKVSFNWILDYIQPTQFRRAPMMWMQIHREMIWYGHHVEFILMTTFIISDGSKDVHKLHRSISKVSFNSILDYIQPTQFRRAPMMCMQIHQEMIWVVGKSSTTDKRQRLISIKCPISKPGPCHHNLLHSCTWIINW